MMKKILLLFLLGILSLSGCGGPSAAETEVREFYKAALKVELGIATDDYDDYSNCLVSVLKDESGLSWEQILTQVQADPDWTLDNDLSEEGAIRLFSCMALLSEEDLVKLGELVDSQAFEVEIPDLPKSELVEETIQGLANNYKEGAFMDSTNEELRTFAECTITALLDAGFNEEELYSQYVGGGWSEDIFNAQTEEDAPMSCFTELMFGPPLELPDGDLFELAVVEYAIYISMDPPPESKLVFARCVLTKIRNAGFSDEDIWRYAVDDYTSGAWSRVVDADVDYSDCYEE